jgi:hypothetical protein
MSNIFYPQGKYRCGILQQGFTTSSKGTPQFVLKFEVMADASGNAVEQQERHYFKAITEKTMEYFVKDLKNLGVSVSNLMQLDPATPGHVSLVGSEVLMYCKHGFDQNGEPKEDWGVGLPDMEMKPPPPDAMRRLNMMFGAAMKQAGGAAPRPASAPKPQPVPQPVAAGDMPSDEDVPW